MSGALERIVRELSRDSGVRLVYLFGSTARGEAGPESDIDLAVVLEERPDWERERGLRARVASAGGAPVDLVILNDAGVVARHEVVTGGRCLFARDVREQAEFEIQAISQYLDFQPVLRLQDQYLRERVEERRRGSPG